MNICVHWPWADFQISPHIRKKQELNLLPHHPAQRYFRTSDGPQTWFHHQLTHILIYFWRTDYQGIITQALLVKVMCLTQNPPGELESGFLMRSMVEKDIFRGGQENLGLAHWHECVLIHECACKCTLQGRTWPHLLPRISFQRLSVCSPVCDEF